MTLDDVGVVSQSAAQVIHTCAYMSLRTIISSDKELKLKSFGPPAWGDYEVSIDANDYHIVTYFRGN